MICKSFFLKSNQYSEAKAHLLALIEKAMAGEEVIIGKAGKPVARLVRYERNRQARQPGALKGKIQIADDFDELPQVIAEAFEAEIGSKSGQTVNPTFKTDKAVVTFHPKDPIKALRGALKGRPSLTKALLEDRKENRE